MRWMVRRIAAQPQGNGKSNDDNFANVWLLDGLATDKGFVFDCTPQPAERLDNCAFEAPPPPDCETARARPTSLTFRYTGEDCSASRQHAGRQIGDKWTAEMPGNEPVSITILKDTSKITVSPISGINVGDLVTVIAKGSDSRQ